MAGKGFDAKAFLVNHTEKLILGAAGLMVLTFLGGSQWSPYKGTPEEIKEKVAKSDAALKNHPWPEDLSKPYEMSQDRIPKQRVHDFLRNPIAVSSYEMSTKFVTSPWQGKVPRHEPSLLALEDALADAGKVLIERLIDPAKLEEEKEKEKEKEKATDPRAKRRAGNRPGTTEQEKVEPATPTVQDDEFATGSRAGAVAGYPGGLGGEAGLPGSGGLPGSPQMSVPPGYGQSNGSYPGSSSGTGAMSSYPGGGMSSYPGMGGGGGGMAGPAREAQGYTFASVRAVFPMKEQIRRYQDATHARTFEIAADSFEVIDFNLERQEQIGRTDTWTDWQPVDTAAAIDVLTQSMDPEPDVVNGVVTNSVITMPLLPRIFGRWGKTNASHPRIEKFALSDEEMRMEVEYQSKLLETLREGKNKPDERAKVKKGGFSSVMGDSRALQSEVFGGSAYGSSDYGGYGSSGNTGGYGSSGGYPGMGGSGMSSMGMGAGGRSSMPPGGGGRGAGTKSKNEDIVKKLLETVDKDEEGKALAKYIESRVSADNDLLLFRYFDFAVEPGKTYQYRVRLVLNNPNFGKLASEAGGEPNVVEGETRTTDWSNVTKPVTIERDIYYFVKDVETRHGGKTRMSLFKWDSKLGTTMNAELELYPGQHIAGTAKKTRVIDPAKSKSEEKDYTFTSSDVFVDTHADVALDKNLHKDLKLPGGSNGDALIPEEALVVQANTGELAVIDPVRQATEQARLEDQQKKQDKSFESLSESATGMSMGSGGSLMGSSMDSYSMMGMGAGKKGGKGGRSKNPLASGGGGYGGGGGSGGGGGYPGMGAGSGAGYPGMGGGKGKPGAGGRR